MAEETSSPMLASKRDGARFYLYDYAVCGRCGQELTERGIPNPLEHVWQKYCPNCGVRLVDR